MESPKGQPEMELPRPPSPCWKKSEDAGFVDNFKDHFHQLVNTSMEQHRICLKKSIREIKDYIRLKKEGKMMKSSEDATASDSAGPNEKESPLSVQEATSL